MAEILGYLIQQDASGYKLAPYVDYDGSVFTLECGEMVGREQGFVADAGNIIAMSQRQKMKTFNDMWYPPYDADQIMKALKKVGHCLDHQWRVRRFMREPVTKLTALHIMPMIEIHKQFCQAKSKNPESTLITLGYFEDKPGLILADDKQMGICPLPTHEGGQFCTLKDRMGFTRLYLKFGDWYATPREARDDQPVCTFTLMHYVQGLEVLEAQSVEEILGTEQFLTPEGVLVGKGSYFNISIDDFLKGV